MFQHRMIPLLLILLLVTTGIGLLSTQMAARPRQIAEQYETITVDGVTRRFFMYIPTTYERDPGPLLIALHSAGSSGRALMAQTALNQQADATNALIVYPDALDYTWNDGRIEAGMPPIMTPVDDVAFIAALIEHMTADYAVDPAQVHLTGYAEGGRMAYTAACQLSQKISSVTTVAAAMWRYQQLDCPFNTVPISLLMIYGDQDPVNQSGAQTVNSSLDESLSFENMGIQQTFNFWRAQNNCDAINSNSPLIQGATCDEGSSVTTIVLPGVGAIWPRINPNLALNQVGLDAGSFLATFINGQPGWREQISQALQTVQVSSTPSAQRTYTLYVPPTYTSAKATPLVLMLHLRPGSGSTFSHVTGMNAVADRYGFVVVYPDARLDSWYYDRGYEVQRPRDYDDSAYLATLISDLRRDLNIDQARVYVAGMSNGGFMTQRLICDLPEMFAAAAVVSASGFNGLHEVCTGKGATPLLFIHGTADTDIQWNGQRNISSVPENITFWAQHNGCKDNYDLTHLSGLQDAPVEFYTYPDCAQALQFYAIPGGGHNWPGLTGRIVAEFTGKVNEELNASAIIWAFFQQQQR